MAANKKTSGIYEIRNVVTDQAYYGSTDSFERRNEEHFSLLERNKHFNPYLQNSYNKYGKDAFVFSPIARFEVEQLLIEELKLLDLYWDGCKQCFNSARHPSAPMTGKTHTDEARKKISEAGLRRSAVPGFVNPSYMRRGELNGKSKSVDQYTLAGNFVATHGSAAEAGRIIALEDAGKDHEIVARGILMNASGDLVVAYKYIWRFRSDPFDKFVTKDPRAYSIKKYDLNKTFIKEYESLNEAVFDTKFSAEYISKRLDGYKTHEDLFIWETNSNKKAKKVIKKTTKPHWKAVCKCDFDGNIIKEYPSIELAWKDNDCSKSYVKDCLNKRKNPTKFSYTWNYKQEINNG